jgi:3-deoxy-D-manno-octulosonate 8-phosphate phosphatase KdsC-like HAD superfamily phosphatase
MIKTKARRIPVVISDSDGILSGRQLHCEEDFEAGKTVGG